MARIKSIFFYLISPITLSAMIVQLSFVPTAASMGEGGLAPPRYRVIDEFGINLTTGQVTADLETVSIGGEMGLSHHISHYTNNFYSNRGYRGYSDKYTGRVEKVTLGKIAKIDGSSNHDIDSWVVRATALGQSIDFKIIQDGAYTSFPDTDRPFTYEALGDSRHTLEYFADLGEIVWTQVDGTRVAYSSTNGGYGVLMHIRYPNDYRIVLHSNDSVTTNTGFQLKYDYIDDTRELDIDKRGRIFGANTNVPLAASGTWSSRNPKYIHAINSAVEYCDPDQNAPCDLQLEWPKATFNWPGGMPRAFFIDDSLLSVVDASGGITEYHYEAHDLALLDPHDASKGKIDNEYVALNEKFSPRLVAIKPADASLPTRRYTYANQIEITATVSVEEFGLGGYIYTQPWIKSEFGLTLTATSLRGTYRYTKGEPTGGPGPWPIKWQSSQHSVTSYQDYPGALVDTYSAYEGYFKFEGNYRNFLINATDVNGTRSAYEYDVRGNLKKITYEKNEDDERSETAEYPTTCTNRLTCNKPKWIKDAKGNQTDFTYHSESGQTATITYPANEQGVRAQTRYTYAQKHAFIKNASGVRQQVVNPIWLKVKEASCVSTNSCTGSSDEVVTQYEYNHDNLLLTGMTVTSAGKTMRTCFSYDRYGNRIGATTPKANLSSCP